MRYWFGGQPADYVVSPGEQVPVTGEIIGYQPILVPGVALWCYDYSSGDRVTDLMDEHGNQTDHITSDEYGGIPRFRGPDETRRLLIGPEPTGDGEEPDDGDDGEGGESQGQWILTSTDWPTMLSRLDERVDSLEQGNGGGDGEDPEVVSTAHPMMWSLPGEVDEDRTSPHSYWNLEGRRQTITRVRAQASVASGTLHVRVLQIDPDSGETTTLAGLSLDEDTPHQTVAPDESVSDGTGVTVAVEREEGAEVEDVTVQVMIR